MSELACACTAMVSPYNIENYTKLKDNTKYTANKTRRDPTKNKFIDK